MLVISQTASRAMLQRTPRTNGVGTQSTAHSTASPSCTNKVYHVVPRFLASQYGRTLTGVYSSTRNPASSYQTPCSQITRTPSTLTCMPRQHSLMSPLTSLFTCSTRRSLAELQAGIVSSIKWRQKEA